MVFKKGTYADWEPSSASSRPTRRTSVAGQDFNKISLNVDAVSSGPFKFDSWQKGTQLTVAQEPAYKAGPKLKLDRVIFRYILDTNARFQALKAGESQVMEPQPQLQIADFLKNSKFDGDQTIPATMGARRHPVRAEGPPGTEAEVRPPGAHHGHQPQRRSGCPVRRPVATAKDLPRAAEPHVQALQAHYKPNWAQSSSARRRSSPC